MENITSKDKDLVIPSNQDLTIHTDKVKSVLRKYWDRDYINQKIDECKNHNHKIFMRFLWITGVRVSEAISVRKRDLNFQDYLIRVRWLKSRKYYERILPMHPDLKLVLELFVANLKADDLLFSFTRQRAYQITKKYLGGSPHMLRHSFAVNWLRCDGDIVMLHRVLGHSKIQTTMEYLKIVPVDQGKELIKIRFR